MIERAVKLPRPTYLHLKGNGKHIFSKLAVSVSYVSRKKKKKEVSGHAPFRRSLRSVKYAKRFQREHDQMHV
jgi:hypothetical protein